MRNEGRKISSLANKFAIGDLIVNRLGFGSMRLTGPGVWGEPPNHAEATAVLRRAVELGINFIDTADSYGPEVAERLITEALYPYPPNLVIATKAGLERPGPDQWMTNGQPKHLRAACEGSLRRLKLQRIDLFQLHRIDPKVPLEDQIKVLLDLQREGKIRYIGLSEVNIEQIKKVRDMAPIVTVQNKYNLLERTSEDVLAYCTREGLGFIPWYPLAASKLIKTGGTLSRIAQQLHATPAQVSLAWLLKKSPVILPIPGTSKVKHLEENVAATRLKIDDKTMHELDRIVDFE